MNAPVARRHLQARPPERELHGFQRDLNDVIEMGEVNTTALTSARYWAKCRRAPVPTDRALAGQTLTWLMTLPRQVRPNATVERFPGREPVGANLGIPGRHQSLFR